MQRTQRLHILKQLLSQSPVATQEELVDALATTGIEVTQATVSRDLTSIGAVRGPDGYRLDQSFKGPQNQNGSASPAPAIQRVLRDHSLGVFLADSMVVLRTMPGHADLVASELDATPPSGMVGCIAGDDTIFIATPNPKSATKLKNTITDILGD